MLLAAILTGVALVGLGFLVRAFPNLIAGYNTMSPEQKKNVDIDSLSRFMKRCLIFSGLSSIALTLLLSAFSLPHLASLMAFVPVVLLVPFLAIGARKFYGNKTSKRGAVFSVTAFVVVSILVFGFIFKGMRKPVVEIDHRHITISSLYPMAADIVEAKLENALPEVGVKTNGFNLGSVLKGDFILDDLGECRLYLQAAHGPYLVLKPAEGHLIVINFDDQFETESLYRQIVDGN